MTRKRLNLLNTYAAFMLITILTPFLLIKAAPLHEYTEIEQYTEGCYYNYHHYNEGDRIITNEPCLNCTCHNKMLMCYLRVCPFTKPISHECTVEKREDQCCPIITCPEVPVDIDQQLTEFSHSLQVSEKFGCSVGGKLYPQGAQVPSNPNKPCELCYCIKNRTSCLIQECTLHIESCKPIYNRGSCCPVRYNCDLENNELDLEDHSDTTLSYTTERTTPGFILTTTTLPQQSFECSHNGKLHLDGMRIYRENACENCYCMHGDIICAVQECNQPMLSNNGITCQALPSNNAECCPKNYICDQNSTIAAKSDIKGTTMLYPDVTTSAKTFHLVDKMHESISQDDMKLQTHIEVDEDTTFQTESPLQFNAKVNEKVTRLIDKNFEDLGNNKKLNTFRDEVEYSTKVYPSYSITPDDKFTTENTERYTTETINEENFSQQSTIYNIPEKYSNKPSTDKLLSEGQIKEEFSHFSTQSFIEEPNHSFEEDISISNNNYKYYTVIPNEYSTIQEEENINESTKKQNSVISSVTPFINRSITSVTGKDEFLAVTELSSIGKTVTYDDISTKGLPFMTETPIDNNGNNGNNDNNDSKNINGILSGLEAEEISTTATNINILTLSNENISAANPTLPFELENFDNETAETSIIPKSDAIIYIHENQGVIDNNQTVTSLHNELLLTKSIETQTDSTTDRQEEVASTEKDEFNEYATTETANEKKFDKIPSGKKTFKIASFNSEILDEEIYFDAQILTSTLPNNLIFSENVEKYTLSKTFIPEQTTTYSKAKTEVTLTEDFTTEKTGNDENLNASPEVITYTTKQPNDYKGDPYSVKPTIINIASTISYDKDTPRDIEDRNNFEQFIDVSYKKYPLDVIDIESQNLYSNPIMHENKTFTSKDSLSGSTEGYELYNKYPTGNEYQKEPELSQTSIVAELFVTTESPNDDLSTLYHIFEKDVTSTTQDLKEKFLETPTTTISIEPETLKAPLKQVLFEKENDDGKISKEVETTYQSIYDKLYTKTIIKGIVHSPNDSAIFNDKLPEAIPGEGSCLIGEKTIEHNSTIPTPSHCKISCRCINSIVFCEHVKCQIPYHVQSCVLNSTSFENCCPMYVCEMYETKKTIHSGLNKVEDNAESMHTINTNFQESTESSYTETFTEAIIPEVLFEDYEEYPLSNTSVKNTEEDTEEEIFSSHPHVPLLNHSNVASSDNIKPQVYDFKSTNAKELLVHATSSLSSPLSSSSFTTSTEESTVPTQFKKTDFNEKEEPIESSNLQQITTEYIEPTVVQHSTEKYYNQQRQTSTQSDQLNKNDISVLVTVDKVFKKPLDITTIKFSNDIPDYTTFMYHREMLDTSRGKTDVIATTTSNGLIEINGANKLDNEMYSYFTRDDELDDFGNQNIKPTEDIIPIINDTIKDKSKNSPEMFPTMATDFELAATTKLIPTFDEMDTQKHLNTYNFEQKENKLAEVDRLNATTHFESGITNSIEFNNFNENGINEIIKTSATENQFLIVTSTETKLNKQSSDVNMDLVTEYSTKNPKTTILPSMDNTRETVTTIESLSKVDLNDSRLFAQSESNKYDDKSIIIHKTLEEQNNATFIEHKYSSTENSIVTTTESSTIKIQENTTESSFWQMNHYDNFHKPEQISIPVERIANESGHSNTTTVTSIQATMPSRIESTTHTKAISATTASYHVNSDNYQQQLPIYAQPPQYPSYPDDDYTEEDETEVFGPGTCRYGGKLYVSAQQIPRDDPCDFCFCFRSDIICLQQSCPPPISGCHEEPIVGFCCPRYECPISIASSSNLTLESTTTSTTLTPSFPYFTNTKNIQRLGCMINDRSYNVGEKIESTSGPCINCLCGGDGNMKCHPQACVPEPTMQQVMAAVAAGRKR